MTTSAVSAATLLSVTLCAACTDRLTAPEAVELVQKVEESLAPGGVPQRWLGDIWKSDVRLGAPLLRTDIRRNAEKLTYRAIVFERVVVPSGQLANSSCAGTRRAAYFWRADSDGVVFFPGGYFDQRLVPRLGSCAVERADVPALIVSAGTLDDGTWMPESVQGDISPGVVTGACRFLEPEAERVLREDHGITCELTTHHVRFEAQRIRLSLDSTDIIGVRYTIDCGAAKSRSSTPCPTLPRTP